MTQSSGHVFVTYAIGLLGTAWLGWLGYASTSLGDQRVDIVGWCWFVPLPYFAAWFVLTLPSLLRAAVITAVPVPMGGMLAGLGFILGLYTGGILAFPAVIVFGGLFGLLAAALQRLMTPKAGWTAGWVRIHGLGGGLAGLGLATTVISAWAWPRDEWSSPTLYHLYIGGILTLGFAWHAGAAWRARRGKEPPVSHPGRRVLVLLAVAYLLPALPLWPGTGFAWAPVWPADLLRRTGEAQRSAAARRTSDAAEVRAWGDNWGRTLAEGERVSLPQLDEPSLSLAAPEGWQARAMPGGLFILRRLPQSAAALLPIDRLQVRLTPFTPAELRALPEPEQSGGSQGPQSLVCARLVALPDVVACTPARARVLPSTPGRFKDLFGDVLSERRFMLLPERRFMLQGWGRPAPLVVFDDGFSAVCSGPLRRECEAQFSFAMGRAEVTSRFDPDDLPRLRQIRTTVDGLLRAATGQGLDDAPTLLQPDGELFQLPPR